MTNRGENLLKWRHEMKICPKCGSHKVIIFDADNDLCQDCGKWFPAVAEVATVKSVGHAREPHGN